MFGKTAFSKILLKPTGVNSEPTLFTGASNDSKHSEAMIADNSAPKPEKTLSSCTTKARFVFFIEFFMFLKLLFPQNILSLEITLWNN